LNSVGVFAVGIYANWVRKEELERWVLVLPASNTGGNIAIYVLLLVSKLSSSF